MTANHRSSAGTDQAARPALVSVAAATMTFAGALVTLMSLVSLFARGPSAAGVDVLRWAFVLFPPILLPIGLLEIVAARAVVHGKTWARMVGIASASVLALFGLLVLGATASAGDLLLSSAWIVANGFVIYALSVAGAWFAGHD